MSQGWEWERNRRFWEQLYEIRRRHSDHRFEVEPAAATRESGTAPRYVYEANRLLCADEAIEEQVRRHLPGRCGAREQTTGGLVNLQVAEDVHIPTEVDRLRRLLGADARRSGGHTARPPVSPNHVVSIAYPVNFCPANEPTPVPPDAPPWPRRVPRGGEGVRAMIVDTGYVQHTSHVADWLAGVAGQPRQPYQADEYGLVKQYAGHGTFVAGVLRCAAPGARVTVANTLQHAGAMLEYQFGQDLMRTVLEQAAQDGAWPHIISLSAGGTSHGSCDLLGLGPFLDMLAHDPAAAKTVLVAAAGNDGNDDNLFFPAASAPTNPGIISVGALRRDQRGRACFSNYGHSVTVFAPGEHHVNAFLTGHYAYQHQATSVCRYHRQPLYGGCTCLDDPDYGTLVHFSGLARWSGTSFATPLVAGLIARHMTDTGDLDDARLAARDLLATRQERIADVDGEILSVLRLPRDIE